MKSVEVPQGAMVAVGLPWEEVKKRLPEGVIAACNNSADSVTISGLKDVTLKFAETLREEGIFAKPVDSMGYAFHTHFIKNLIAPLRPYYEKVSIFTKINVIIILIVFFFVQFYNR